jgi:hypothetical protein
MRRMVSSPLIPLLLIASLAWLTSLACIFVLAEEASRIARMK